MKLTISLGVMAAYFGFSKAGYYDWYNDLKGYKVNTMQGILDYANSAEGGSGKSAVFANMYQNFCGNCRDEMPDWN